MDSVELRKTKGLKGSVHVPPDKSISHRAVLFATLAAGTSRVRRFLRAADPLSTLQAVRALGVTVEDVTEQGTPPGEGDLLITGRGVFGLSEPRDIIDCGNSGTTMRLLSGILSGNPFFSVLTGDESLRQRPMGRIIQPLRQMGALISGRDGDRLPPLAITGGRLNPIHYTLPVASAQVKSCLLLAGLHAEGKTRVVEPFKSRDHTERMLLSMGARAEVDGCAITVEGGAPLAPLDMTVPSDISSAAFFIAAALMVPGSEVVISGVGMNPTRTGFLAVLAEMGAKVQFEHVRDVSGEPVADLVCRTAGRLRAVKLDREAVPSVIDEFPVLCALAARAEGVTEIRGAEELRVKESDRISAMATELRKLGVDLEEYPDGIAIRGGPVIQGGDVESHGDHRIAMALSVAGLTAEGPVRIHHASCVDISFPAFFETLRTLASER